MSAELTRRRDGGTEGRRGERNAYAHGQVLYPQLLMYGPEKL